VKVLKSLTPLGVALAIGVVPLTLSTSALAATHVAPPIKSYCAPLVNNLEALRVISVMSNIPTAATVATGPRVETYLTNFARDLDEQGKILSADVTNAHSPSHKALLRTTISELRGEVTRVLAYSETVQQMTTTKNSTLLKMANSDVAVDANKSCIVWAQQLIVGFVFAEATIGSAQDGPFPGDGPNAAATAKDLRMASRGYGGRIGLTILTSTPRNGTLRSAKVAITQSKYTVDVCLRFSGKDHNDYEAFNASVC